MSTPAPQQVPQVVIPARPPVSSPEVQQKMPPKTPAKKQLQRLQSQPSVEKESKPPIDYQVLLLSLADEYFKAAHSQGTMVALQKREIEIEEYYKLVATGLGCLEAVLKVCSSDSGCNSARTDDILELETATPNGGACAVALCTHSVRGDG